MDMETIKIAMYKYKKDLYKRGSITVEASIILPLIILAITAIMYMSLLWFQNTCIKMVADMAVERGAESWRNMSVDISTGKVNKTSTDENKLYWRIVDSKKEYKIKKIEEYIEKELTKRRLLQPQHEVIDVEVRDCVIYKKLSVYIENSYAIPAAGLFRTFGLSDTYVVRTQSEAVIDDTTELIRNTDFVIDIKRELENKYPEFEKFTKQIQDVIDDIKHKVYDFTQ